MPPAEQATPALELAGVSWRRDGASILEGIDWRVERDERWVVLGPNGSGKTSLIRIAGLYEHPSTGTVDVLGERLGRTDVRRLRTRIGFVSPALSDQLRAGIIATDVVVCGLHAALEPWWHRYSDDERSRARSLLHEVGVGHVAGHPFGTLSSGERQRVMLARQMMADPELVLLDEPTAGLDLAGREAFVAALEGVEVTAVLVTHHVEEIPRTTTHALMVRDGRIRAAGPIDEVLDASTLSDCFGLALHVERRGGRWVAWHAP